jgi:hypothetical protein
VEPPVEGGARESHEDGGQTSADILVNLDNKRACGPCAVSMLPRSHLACPLPHAVDSPDQAASCPAAPCSGQP